MKALSILVITVMIRLMISRKNNHESNLKYLDNQYPEMYYDSNVQVHESIIKDNRQMKSLGFYLKNIYNKNNNPAIRSFIDPSIESIFYQIKCILIDLESYKIYDFHTLHDLMNTK